MPKQKTNNSLYGQLFQELKSFALQVTEKFSNFAAGEPEDQLRGPIESLFGGYGSIISQKIILKGESSLHNRLGRPDFGAIDKNLLIGYIELKAPGKGANPALYKGHDLKQWKRFKNVPNIIYTDGNEWGLYRNGELIEERIKLTGDIRYDGIKAVNEANAKKLFQLFANFTSWTPIVPDKSKALAAFLAPFCQLIREDVLDALTDASSSIQTLKREIKQLLFPEADDAQFADAYAQTIVFALLLARMEGADVLNLSDAYGRLESHHLLLSRSLNFLTDPQALTEIASSVALAQRVIHEIPRSALDERGTTEDPWLFFYEDFLAAYDPKLRKESGVYYTPVEVTRCQVRLIDEILGKYLGQEMGFIEPEVATLDPGVGTGTYLLGIVDHALNRVENEEGPGAVSGAARALIKNLHGFEWMVGPYAVCQLRFTRALTRHGAKLPKDGPSIYLTNTLESPHTKPPAPPLFHQPIAREHERALKVKDKERVLICLGNPPYGRHEAATKENRATTGGWVRHVDESDPTPPILEDFIEPARAAGYGVHLKNLYNHYVYFIRWALWKVFEHKTATGPGIVSLITASSYLDGDAFVGVREHMRRVCDHIDIIDLGGEGRGTRQDENVFAIQTPVAIFIAWREGSGNLNEPAVVRYTRINGTKAQKLKTLDSTQSADNIQWNTTSNDWQAAFRPKAKKAFSNWPNLTDIFPWQNNDVQCKRTWIIAPSNDLLLKRWTDLLKADDRGVAMKESGDRTISLAQNDILDVSSRLPAIESLKVNEEPRNIVAYAYRSFDRQYLLADNRLISRPRHPLWLAHSEQQLYLTSLFSIPLGEGPAVVVCSNIPDLDYFRGSYGAKAVMPLYRDAGGSQTNILPGLLDLLKGEYRQEISPSEFLSYVYAVLAQPDYTRRFAKELSDRKVRIPLTKDGQLFFRVSEYGQWLIWLHTYGERITGKDRPNGRIPRGKAKCLFAVPDSEEKYPNEYEYSENTERLFIGDGSFGPVSREVFEFEVSGLKVVKSWLGYRMRERSGRKSSPLDDIRPRVWTHEFTRELLELLWVLEHTVNGYPRQKELLEGVLSSDLFLANELPKVPDEARKPPKVPSTTTL
jgi:hypothetical protein